MSEIDRAESKQSRWRLLRDVLGFQLKLVFDGLRDVLLSPVSIGAALLGALIDSDEPGKYFYRLLMFGHESDRWINLFNTAQDPDGKAQVVPGPDSIVRKAESLVIAEYQRGTAARNLRESGISGSGAQIHVSEDMSDPNFPGKGEP